MQTQKCTSGNCNSCSKDYKGKKKFSLKYRYMFIMRTLSISRDLILENQKGFGTLKPPSRVLIFRGKREGLGFSFDWVLFFCCFFFLREREETGLSFLTSVSLQPHLTFKAFKIMLQLASFQFCSKLAFVFPLLSNNSY